MRLTAAARNALPTSAFAGPNRTYPVPDQNHAVFAKAMATAHAAPGLRTRIRTTVARRFPGLGKKPGLRDRLTSMRSAGAFSPKGGY